MKVLQLSSEKYFRGGERQISFLCSTLIENNIDCIVAARNQSEMLSWCKQQKVPHLSLGFKNSFDLVSAYKLAAFCRQHNVDIVHAHSSKSHSIAILSTLFYSKVKIIVSRRVAFKPSQSLFTKWKYTHPSISCIVCVSHYITTLMQTYTKGKIPCVTIYSGVKPINQNQIQSLPDIRKEFNVDKDAILVGNTSALEIEKDYHTFILAVSHLNKLGINACGIIFGKGKMQEALMTFVRSVNANDKIIFAGHKQDVISYLAAMDVFLMSSKSEGLGTSVLDAFQCGIPVVSSNAGGLPEMVIHEQTGMLANVGDAETMALHIEKIVKNENLKARLIANAKEKVKDFSVTKMGEKTITVYKQYTNLA